MMYHKNLPREFFMKKPGKISQPKNVRLNNTSRALFIIDEHEFILSFSTTDAWVRYINYQSNSVSKLKHTDNNFELSLLNDRTYIVTNSKGMFRCRKL